MRSLPFDIYPFLRPLLFRMDAERAHELAIQCLKKGLVPKPEMQPDPVLQTTVWGLNFAHPLGLAAGFDKHAEVIPDVLGLGFSFTEIGGVTPLPQPGNAKPRLFRLPESKALINRFGFNSEGSEAVLRRLVAYRDTQTRAVNRSIIGVNLAKNKESADAADDYAQGVLAFAPYADFVTLNISSPNTPGLRDLQDGNVLSELLQRTGQVRAAAGAPSLLFLKISPDLTDAQAADIAEVALAATIDGMIVGNTTVTRPDSMVLSQSAKEKGGLSGKPLFDLSTKLLARMFRLTEGKIPLIGVGGVFSGEDAYAKIRAGASLIQIYTALIYNGPMAAKNITTELAALLKRDGFALVAEAVGADSKK